MKLVRGFAAGMLPLVAQSELTGGRPDACERQNLISCAATLGRSDPTTAASATLAPPMRATEYRRVRRCARSDSQRSAPREHPAHEPTACKSQPSTSA